MEICNKLSEIVTLESSNGDWDNYENKLYGIFKEDFLDNTQIFMEKPVGIFTDKMYHDKEKTFWHIISDGPDEFNREPNIRRCERIKWPKEFIIGICSDCNKIKAWKSIHKNKKMRYKIWCTDINYLVVLEERKTAFMLITSYILTYKHAIRKLEEEYDESEKFSY